MHLFHQLHLLIVLNVAISASSWQFRFYHQLKEIGRREKKTSEISGKNHEIVRKLTAIERFVGRQLAPRIKIIFIFSVTRLHTEKTLCKQ